jgi:hypothetical protein
VYFQRCLSRDSASVHTGTSLSCFRVITGFSLKLFPARCHFVSLSHADFSSFNCLQSRKA